MVSLLVKSVQAVSIALSPLRTLDSCLEHAGCDCQRRGHPRAAAGFPAFLPCARHALMCQHRVLSGVADGGAVSAPSHQEVDQERAAVRLAAQAAAGALSSVCPCHNIVICPSTLHHSGQVCPIGLAAALNAGSRPS